MKNVNIKLFAIIYTLNKRLTKKLDEMKKAIIEGANTTFKDYANVKVVECTRTSYDKEAQAKLDKFAEENCIAKTITHYKRVEIDNISIEIEEKANNIIQTLENANDKTIKRVASKVADKK